MPPSMEKSIREKRTSFFVSVFIIAMLARGAVLFLSLDSFNDDPDAYRSLAENMYAYGVFGEKDVATAFRPPLYPATLTALVPLRTPTERPTKLNSVCQNANRSRSSNLKTITTFFNQKLALSRNASIALWHWILGVATVALAYALALKLDLSRPLAAFAALLVAIDPILLQQSRLIMTETLAAFFAVSLLLSTIAVVQRRQKKAAFITYFLLGTLYGLSTLCRPTFFLFLALTLLNLILIESRSFQTSRQPSDVGGQVPDARNFSPTSCCVRILCFILGCACCVAPWSARNYRVFGKPILTTTHGGYTLLLANNPEIYQHYATASSPWVLWNPDEFFKRNKRDYEEAIAKANIDSPEKKELFQDKWSRQTALSTIKGSPSIFAYSCFIRFGELWRFLPNDVDSKSLNSARGQAIRALGTTIDRSLLKNGARYTIAAFYLIEFIVAFIGCMKLYRMRRFDANQLPLISSPFVWGFLLILSVQIPHLLYWTNMRMRAPLEIFLPILVAVAFFSNRAIPKAQNNCNQ